MSTHRATLDVALQPAEPGRLVSILRPLSRGMSQTAEQIVRYADHWREQAHRTLEVVAAEPDTHVLVALGDSIAQGIGADRATFGYVGLLAHRLGPEPVPVLNLSRSGARMRDVLDVQLPALADVLPERSTVVCTVGSNDLLRSARPSRIAGEINELVTALPAHAVLATVPALNSLSAKSFNRRLRAEADNAGLAIADIGRRLESWKGLSAADRFHPNSEGHRLWAETFATRLQMPLPNR